MNMTLRLGAVVAVLGLAGGLYALRAPEEPVPAASGAAATAMPAPAVPATAPTPVPAAEAPVTQGSRAAPGLAAEDRAATRAARLEALPVVLQAADAAMARVRGELATLQQRGAPAAEREALAQQLQRMQAAREQLLARNADVATAH